MKRLRATSALPILATLGTVWIVASCAAQDDEHTNIVFEDGGSDASHVITEPDGAALRACADGRWCAVTLPVEGPVLLNGIWGSGPGDVWMVGSPDFAIHWDGVAFTSTRLNTTQTVFGIWGSGAADVWAFSTGQVLWHHDGTTRAPAGWSAFDKDGGLGESDGGPPPWTGPILSLWGRSETDIWGVGHAIDGELRTVWHSEGWNGGRPGWVPTPTTPGLSEWDPEPGFNAVWGSVAGDVWIVGEKGKTRHSSGWRNGGATWTVVDSGTSMPLFAVWGTGTDDVWAAGGGGVVRRFTRQADGTIAVADVEFPSRATIRALSGSAANDIWAAGSDGLLAHWDGLKWTTVDIGGAARGATNELFALWTSGPDDVWAVGRNILLHKGSTLLPGTKP